MWSSLSCFGSLLSMLVDHILFFKATRTTSASFSTQIADVSLSPWRKSTVKQYNVYLEKWSTFCLSRQSHFMRAPVSLILGCVDDLYTKGYGYSSLNTLYNIDKTDNGQKIGKHPLICRFLKDVFNESPPTPKFQEVWPVEQALAYLEQLTTLHALKLKELTLKLVMLTAALVTGQRCQTLTFLDISGEQIKKKFLTHFAFLFIGTP